MKKLGRLQYIIPLSLFLLLIILVPSVFAVGKPDDVGRPIIDGLNDVGKKPTVMQGRSRQRACQAKENAIKKRVERLGKLAANMQEKFEAIAKRVEEYYTTKVVPSGKTVANHNSLMADIQTKKGAVQTALTQAQTDAASFTCTSDDPRGQMTQFKDDMKVVKSALKDYRTAIKNLIVAVRSVTRENE